MDVYANRIFVTKLAHEMTEDDVRNYFETFGELIDFYMPFTSEGKHKGIAFISFSEADMKAAVLEEETHLINGIEIVVDEAAPKPQGANGQRPSGGAVAPNGQVRNSA